MMRIISPDYVSEWLYQTWSHELSEPSGDKSHRGSRTAENYKPFVSLYPSLSNGYYADILFHELISNDESGFIILPSMLKSFQHLLYLGSSK